MKTTYIPQEQVTVLVLPFNIAVYNTEKSVIN